MINKQMQSTFIKPYVLNYNNKVVGIELYDVEMKKT